MPDRLRGTTPGSVGRLAPGTQLRVVAAETERDLGDGETGELWVRGAQVMRGYLDDTDATAATLTPQGWLRTGDLGYVRGGEVYVVGIKELVKVDGYQVAPAEVEAVLLSHPDDADAVVVARPDDAHGEVPIALVVGPAEPAVLADWVGQRLAPYKRPVAFTSVEKVPRTPSGKVLRRLLTQPAQTPKRIESTSSRV